MKQEELEIQNQEELSNLSEEEMKEHLRIKMTQKYDENKNTLVRLKAKIIIYHTLIFLTKFYWLFLFFFVCIIFALKYFTFSIVIFLMIFGISFIAMFHNIIHKLENYLKEPSFFISKLVRTNEIERPSNLEANKTYRIKAFKGLLFFSLFFIFVVYLYCIYDIIENL